MSGWGFAGALVDAGTQIGMGIYNNHFNAKEARAADKRALANAQRLSSWQAKYLPKYEREGLEAAGYNPMLALGNLGHSSAGMGSSHVATSNMSYNGASSAKLGEFLEDLAKDKAKADVENIEADTELKNAQKNEAKQRALQSAATTQLTTAQTERSEIGYVRDIVDSAVDVAGTGAQIYSAKSMSDMAKQNANRQNAKPNAKPRARGNAGKPAVQGSANSKPSAGGAVGSSAKGTGKIVKELIDYLGPAALIGAGLGTLEGKNKAREMKRGDHWDPKDQNNRKEKARKKWYLYHDIGF